MNSEPENDVVARCRRGDARAWDEVFDAHYTATARFIFQLSSDFTHADVEEICQEVFLSVIQHIDSFRGSSRLQTWIFRIAANKARDYRNRQIAAKRGGGQTTVSLQAELSSDGDLKVDPAGTALSPDAALMRNECVDQVAAALDQVGEPCREVIELRYFGDLSYEEISAELNLNPKTVSSRLSKCLDRLEEIFRKTFSGRDSSPVPV